MAAKKRRMARTMIAIWGSGARHEWARAPRAEGRRGWVPPGLPAGRTCRQAAGQRWQAAHPERCSSGRDSVAAPCSRQSSGSPCVRGKGLSSPQPFLKSLSHAERSAELLPLTPKFNPTKPCKIRSYPARIALYLIGFTTPQHKILLAPRHPCSTWHFTDGESKAQRSGGHPQTILYWPCRGGNPHTASLMVLSASFGGRPSPTPGQGGRADGLSTDPTHRSTSRMRLVSRFTTWMSSSVCAKFTRPFLSTWN